MCNIEEIKKGKPTDEFEFVCENCGGKFTRTKRYISKNKYKIPIFCCVECQKDWYEKNSYIEVECGNCGKKYKITKGDYNKNKTKRFFCSHSCAATINNKLRSEKSNHKKGYDECPKCGNLKTYTSELCQKCRNKENRKINNRTLGSYIDGQKYLSSKTTMIRKAARRVLEESGREKVCQYCHNHEFDSILEAHHIKGVLEFNPDTTIGEINDENNLVWLCPNHHRMLELGLIKL